MKYVDILKNKNKSLTIAVMGCEVNGPGEASHADFGLAGGREGEMLLFSHGEKLGKVKAEDAVISLINEIDRII